MINGRNNSIITGHVDLWDSRKGSYFTDSQLVGWWEGKAGVSPYIFENLSVWPDISWSQTISKWDDSAISREVLNNQPE